MCPIPKPSRSSPSFHLRPLVENRYVGVVQKDAVPPPARHLPNDPQLPQVLSDFVTVGADSPKTFAVVGTTTTGLRCKCP